MCYTLELLTYLLSVSDSCEKGDECFKPIFQLSTTLPYPTLSVPYPTLSFPPLPLSSPILSLSSSFCSCLLHTTWAWTIRSPCYVDCLPGLASLSFMVSIRMLTSSTWVQTSAGETPYFKALCIPKQVQHSSSPTKFWPQAWRPDSKRSLLSTNKRLGKGRVWRGRYWHRLF